MTWNQTQELSAESLNDLFDNKISSVAVSDFLNVQECLVWKEALYREGLQIYDYDFEATGIPTASHLMTTHYLFEEDENPEKYLEQAEASNKLYARMAQETEIDILKRFDDLLFSHNCFVKVPQEKNILYSRVLARELKNGASLHADYAPFLKVDWQIRQIDAELAWNIYLDVPQSGGECHVYNKPWEKSDNQFIMGSSYGYDEQVVTGRDSQIIKPILGRLVLFNSRNFHKVSDSPTNRLTLGGHLGRQSCGKFLAWV